MELKVNLNDAAVEAYRTLGIDPQTDLNARVAAQTAAGQRKREKDMAPLAAKLAVLNDTELAPLKTAIEAAYDAKLPQIEPATPAVVVDAGLNP
jgi:hypothetical protein